MSRYTFGDDEAAARRLAVVAEVFAPTTDEILTLAVDRLPASAATAVDLGCGPGHTTVQLAAHLPYADVVGLDRSPSFLAAARERGTARCSFVVGDVTEPLPEQVPSGRPFDLVYARFLLAHLPDVAGQIWRWSEALAPGGVLVLEEPEHISSDDGDFAAYEAVTAGRVAGQGTDMYAGPLVAEAPDPEGTIRWVDRVVAIDMVAGRAAEMFAGNLDSWGHEHPELGDLHARLRSRTADPTTGLFDWKLRQSGFVKAAA